jgi:heme A synthase
MTNTETVRVVVECIDKPLGFFVLALLIVEAFLGSVLIFSKLTEEHQFYGMFVGVGMFIVVILIVSILVWNKPHNLMYDTQKKEFVDVPYALIITSPKPKSVRE